MRPLQELAGTTPPPSGDSLPAIELGNYIGALGGGGSGPFLLLPRFLVSVRPRVSLVWSYIFFGGFILAATAHEQQSINCIAFRSGFNPWTRQ